MHKIVHLWFISNYFTGINALYELTQGRYSHKFYPSSSPLYTMEKCTTRYILYFWPVKSWIFVHCTISVKVYARKVTIWSQTSQKWRNKINQIYTQLKKIISYLTISISPSYDKNCESYSDNSDKFTLVHARNY